MTASEVLKKRRSLFLGILFVAFFTFTADIVDLREELHILSCSYSCLDSNVATGLISAGVIQPEPLCITLPGPRMSSVTISFIHLLPYSFRAPPA
jgi:hypothetical protein